MQKKGKNGRREEERRIDILLPNSEESLEKNDKKTVICFYSLFFV